MPSEDHKGSGPPSPSDAIAEAIRAIVRDELKRPGPAPAPDLTPEQKPTWQDGLWLLVLIANLVLVVGLVPETLWKDPVLDIPSKILPWVGGGTFILGATWFRERLLTFSRRQTFKIVMACGFVPLLLVHIPFLSLRPKIDPPDSQLYVDDVQRKGSFQGKEKIPLRLKGHTFKIQPYDAGSKNVRVIEWSWTRLLWAWWGNHQPQWALIYPMTIVSDGVGCKVYIKKYNSKEPLDTDFYDEHLKRVADSLEFEPSSDSDIINLPMGKYNISVEKAGCETRMLPKPVSVPLDADLDLGTMKCQAQ